MLMLPLTNASSKQGKELKGSQKQSVYFLFYLGASISYLHRARGIDRAGKLMSEKVTNRLFSLPISKRCFACTALNVLAL